MWCLRLGAFACLLSLQLVLGGESEPAGYTPSPPAATPAPAAPATPATPAANATGGNSASIVDASNDICKTCECDIQTLLVNCSYKDLTNHFPNPDDWARLPFQPKTVLLDHNNLVHVLPFARLDALEKLSMSHNHISKIDERAFWNLSDVVEIDLSHNHLTSDDFSPHIFQSHYAPENYEPLEKCRVLRLGSNALHSLHPDLLMHLPHLEELYLDSNPLKVIDHNTLIAITNAQYLKVLDLSRTMIKELPDHFLHTPRFLEKLLLSGNSFVAPPEGLDESHALQYLDLSENPFTNLTCVPAMANLSTLVISHSANLTEVAKGAFSRLPSLSHLYLHSNPRLASVHPYALVEEPEPPAETHVYPPIKTLHLHDNAMGYLESSLVGRWDEVSSLRLDGNPWVCDCENQWMIETLLPSLERADPKFGLGLTCASPLEMRGQSLRQLQSRAYHMRCLDLYGNRPERDASILVGVLVGVLLAAPATLALVMVWRRCPSWSRSARRRGNDYASAFYKPAETEPDFI